MLWFGQKTITRLVRLVAESDTEYLKVRRLFSKIVIVKQRQYGLSATVSKAMSSPDEYFESVLTPSDGIYAESNSILSVYEKRRVKIGQVLCKIIVDSEIFKVKSPCSGVVFAKHFKQGDKVMQGYPLFIIQKKTPIKFS